MFAATTRNGLAAAGRYEPHWKTMTMSQYGLALAVMCGLTVVLRSFPLLIGRTLPGGSGSTTPVRQEVIALSGVALTCLRSHNALLSVAVGLGVLAVFARIAS
jgi:hypothetical protein